MTLIGSGIILETIWHWWYIYIIGPDVTERVGDYETLIYQALETKYITKDDVEMLKVWREDPSIWNK